MLRQLIQYIKFLWSSTNQHGVHSPFVYRLVTRCFYDKTEYPAYKMISRNRQQLLRNRDSITVTDFGAGSRVFTSDKRKVAAIAKNAGIPPKRARLLNRLVRYLKVENALELGSSVGLGTTALAADNRVEVTSIEGCPRTAAVAEQQFRRLGLQNIDLRTGEFREVLQQLLSEYPQPLPFSLVFVDGNHQKAATLEYFHTLLPTAHNDSVFIFDDIHWSRGMEEAWEEIKKHPAVSVSIDTFFWGLVFFRKEQVKQDFVIRV